MPLKRSLLGGVISKSPVAGLNVNLFKELFPQSQMSTHKQNIRYSFIMLILNPMFLVTMFGAAKKCGLDSGDILVSMKKDFSCNHIHLNAFKENE